MNEIIESKEEIKCDECGKLLLQPHSRLHLYVFNDLNHDVYFCSKECLMDGIKRILNVGYDVMGLPQLNFDFCEFITEQMKGGEI